RDCAFTDALKRLHTNSRVRISRQRHTGQMVCNPFDGRICRNEVSPATRDQQLKFTLVSVVPESEVVYSVFYETLADILFGTDVDVLPVTGPVGFGIAVALAIAHDDESRAMAVGDPLAVAQVLFEAVHI